MSCGATVHGTWTISALWALQIDLATHTALENKGRGHRRWFYWTTPHEDALCGKKRLEAPLHSSTLNLGVISDHPMVHIREESYRR